MGRARITGYRSGSKGTLATCAIIIARGSDQFGTKVLGCLSTVGTSEERVPAGARNHIMCRARVKSDHAAPFQTFRLERRRRGR